MLIQPKSSPKKQSDRNGTLTIELLFVLPVAVILILAMVEFSMILVARQQVAAASREGGRVAAIGGNQMEIEAAVETFLDGNLSGAMVQSQITDAFGTPIPSGGTVTVVVSVPTAQAVPNLLAPFGFSIANDVIHASTKMRRE